MQTKHQGITTLAVLLIILGAVVIAAGVFFGIRYYASQQQPLDSPPIVAPEVETITTGSVDFGNLDDLQSLADQGKQTDYLDPLKTAKIEGIKYGFSQNDVFVFKSKNFAEAAGTYLAEVEVTHNKIVYIIQLIQPEKQGETGIWAINSIREK